MVTLEDVDEDSYTDRMCKMNSVFIHNITLTSK